MNSVYCEKDKCCGCTACCNICPKSAISMVEDYQGFLYPKIDKSLCIDCGLCTSVCQFAKPEIVNPSDTVYCYALKHKNIKIIEKSRSAGAFTAFSDYVLGNNGIVYGVAFDNNFFVRHQRASTTFQRDLFRESKYVQSFLGMIFADIKKDLKENKLVLFSGTPCQCDGLRAYLLKCGLKLDNLILMDLVCHGVPSPKMFSEYIEWNEKKYKSKIVDFRFRDKKKYFWGDGIERLTFQNNKKVYQDYFTGSCFDLFIRPSCYNCKYTTVYRNSDISIADFWGVEKVCPSFFDRKNGCSLVILHTAKGNSLFNNIRSDVFAENVSYKYCLQPNLQHPRVKPNYIDSYWCDYKKFGFDFILKKYFKNNVTYFYTYKRKLLSLAKSFLSFIRGR